MSSSVCICRFDRFPLQFADTILQYDRLAPGVHCEYLDQGFLPIATVISYDELARTAFHTRGRIIGHEPEAIKDFVQTSCRDCGASLVLLSLSSFLADSRDETDWFDDCHIGLRT